MGLHLWGDDFYGQLGDGTEHGPAVEVPGVPSVLAGWERAPQILLGASHTMARMPDGHLEGIGANEYGGFGCGNHITPIWRTPVESLAAVCVQFAVGRSHTITRTAAGGVEIMGGNEYGQLGVNVAPLEKLEGGLEMPWASDTPVAPILPAGLKARLVAAGATNCYLVDQHGNLWGSGENSRGQLCDAAEHASWVFVQLPAMPGGRKIVALDGGDKHAVALLRDGTVATWGNGHEGQLGREESQCHVPTLVPGVTTAVAVAAAGELTLILLRSGELLVAGLGQQLHPAPGMPAVTVIAAGTTYWLAVAGGTVWGCEDNSHGQLGDGTREYRAEPVNIGLPASWVGAGELHSAAM